MGMSGLFKSGSVSWCSPSAAWSAREVRQKKENPVERANAHRGDWEALVEELELATPQPRALAPR